MNIDSIWQSALDEKLWSGAVVYGGTPDHVFYRRVGGIAWPDDGIPMQKDSIFDIASVTKVLGTATLAAVLHDSGQLDLDAPFTHYLPECSDKLLLPITVRDLALHISGFSNSVRPYQKAKTGQLMGQAVLKTLPVNPPSKIFEYACINYILLGYVIEAITGVSLAETAHKIIFKPLAMQDTTWGEIVSLNHLRCVKMVNAEKRGDISDGTANLIGCPIGNAGIFSTADDLACFCRMMLKADNGLLTPEAYRLLTSDCMPSKIGHPHAVGWDMAKEFCPFGMSGATIYHSGWTGQTIWIDPQTQRYVIVLTNRTGDWLESKNRRLQLAEAILANG